MIFDELRKFPAISFRGVPFPLSSLENSFTHDNVIHRFPFLDGQHIEALGRQGFNFLCKIPFNNGVIAGPGEAWAGQRLYPELFRKFINAVADKSTGEFVHPDIGPIKVKAADVNWPYRAQVRDGVEVTCRFYQSDDDTKSDTFLSSQAPLATAMASGEALDAELEAAGQLPELANDTRSFSDMMKDYNDGFRGLGPVHSKLDNTSRALTRLDSVSNWPLRAATDNMRHSALMLDRHMATQNGRARQYTVPVGTSLPSIAIRLGIGTDVLVRMNPALARSPYVREGTRVTYVPVKF